MRPVSLVNCQLLFGFAIAMVPPPIESSSDLSGALKHLENRLMHEPLPEEPPHHPAYDQLHRELEQALHAPSAAQPVPASLRQSRELHRLTGLSSEGPSAIASDDIGKKRLTEPQVRADMKAIAPQGDKRKREPLRPSEAMKAMHALYQANRLPKERFKTYHEKLSRERAEYRRLNPHITQEQWPQVFQYAQKRYPKAAGAPLPTAWKAPPLLEELWSRRHAGDPVQPASAHPQPKHASPTDSHAEGVAPHQTRPVSLAQHEGEHGQAPNVPLEPALRRPISLPLTVGESKALRNLRSRQRKLYARIHPDVPQEQYPPIIRRIIGLPGAPVTKKRKTGASGSSVSQDNLSGQGASAESSAG